MERQIEKTHGWTQETNPANVMPIARIRRAVNRYLEDRGVKEYCEVMVNQQGFVFEVKGTVDSQWTRAVVFSMIPTCNGKRHIVDRLQVLDETIQDSFTYKEVLSA
jgi:hypothetical protein